MLAAVFIIFAIFGLLQEIQSYPFLRKETTSVDGLTETSSSPDILSSPFTLQERTDAFRPPSYVSRALFGNEAVYTANFDKTNSLSAYSSGVSGQFTMTVSPTTGEATYVITLDLAAFKSPSPIVTAVPLRLKYHLHTAWNALGKTEPTCAAEETGGHYDPTARCSKFSTLKVSGSERCNFAPPYTCSPERQRECELGDLSGKTGELVVNPTSHLVQVTVFSDYNPPIATQYSSYMRDVTQGDFYPTVVFHDAATDTRLFCGQLDMNRVDAPGTKTFVPPS